jgi:hypothetical protein
MIKKFIITIITDKDQIIPKEALFQVFMNGLANGHPFNLGIRGLNITDMEVGKDD